MIFQRLIFLLAAAFIFLGCFSFAASYKDVRSWHEYQESIDKYNGESILFWKDMEYDVKGEIPKLIRKKYSRYIIFIISPAHDWRPIFFAADKRLLKKRLDNPVKGQRMLIKGKVKSGSMASRYKKSYVVELEDMIPYFDVESLDDENIKPEEYTQADINNLKLEFDGRLGDKVILEVKFSRISKLFDKLDKVMGLDSEEWFMIFPHEESEERFPFFINSKSQEKYYELAKDLKWGEKIKVYGRVILRPDWAGDRGGLVVDRIQRLNNSANKSQGDVSEENNKHDNNIADNQNEDNNIVLKTTPGKIKARAEEFRNRKIELIHVYHGYVDFPKEISEGVPPIKNRDWIVLRNRHTDLEGIIAIFEKGNMDFKNLLKEAEDGDSIELKGTIRIHDEDRKIKVFFIVDAISLIMN